MSVSQLRAVGGQRAYPPAHGYWQIPASHPRMTWFRSRSQKVWQFPQKSGSPWRSAQFAPPSRAQQAGVDPEQASPEPQ
jgi:hypothetical protein